MTATKAPADLNSPTGYCSHRNHSKCPYRPGGACENGIALSDGGFYMCPCSCHMQQKHAVQGKRLQVSLAARIRTTEHADDAAAQADVMQNPDDDGMPDPVIPEVSEATHSRAKELVSDGPAPARKGRPASPKSTVGTPKRAGKGKAAAKEGLTSAEKRDVRVKMAAVLREMGERNLPGKGLSAREMAYVEAHWLKYIDPDLDKARRDAAAAK